MKASCTRNATVMICNANTVALTSLNFLDISHSLAMPEWQTKDDGIKPRRDVVKSRHLKIRVHLNIKRLDISMQSICVGGKLNQLI